ncbi:MAG: ComF family protein, partial [Pseudooceanicola nanhaiensis]|uniref:ComF family protein n=1 Tax=Pseudooceanicola nanhaiensis TaxID=375761 RepID=UPI0040591747
ARALEGVDTTGMLLAPVPLHRWRLVRRRYNQSALLARALGRWLGAEVCPDLLERVRRTPVLDGKGVEARFVTLDRALVVPDRRAVRLRDRHVLLVDDVMTSGATLAEATRACLEAGAADVSVVTLARVAKEP